MTIHYSVIAGSTLCGADDANQATTTVARNVSCADCRAKMVMAVYLRQEIEQRLITGTQQVEIIPSSMSDAELSEAISVLLAEHKLRHGGRK